MNIKKLINRIKHKHDYDVFIEQHIINGGMNKLITRKCSKCEKIRTATMSKWI
jgi:deoxyxylulose-5-phosphate synthase